MHTNMLRLGVTMSRMWPRQSWLIRMDGNVQPDSCLVHLPSALPPALVQFVSWVLAKLRLHFLNNHDCNPPRMHPPPAHTLPHLYLSTSGCTGTPATKAPRLKGMMYLLLVVVPSGNSIMGSSALPSSYLRAMRSLTSCVEASGMAWSNGVERVEEWRREE